MHRSPNKVFKNLGSPRTGNDLRPQVTSLSTRQTDQKTIGPFAPTRAPHTKTQQLLREVEGNHFTPRNHVELGYQIDFHSVPVQLHVPVTKCSGFNSSPCRCRSEQTPVNRNNKGNSLFKRKLPQQTVPSPKNGGTLPSSDRPQPAQQVCRELTSIFKWKTFPV